MTWNFIAGKRLLGASIIGLLLAVTGCASQPYESGVTFYPKPAVVRVVHSGPDEESPLAVLASIEGIRRADPDHNLPPAVVVKLKFENSGPSQITFDPGSLALETGSLRPFPRPQVQPPAIIDLAPGQRQEVTATFPLPPPGDTRAVDLGNLRLRWQVRIDNFAVAQTALFEERAGGGSAPEYSSDVAY